MVISPSQASRRFLANAAAGDDKLRLICNNLIEFVIRQIVELHGATVRPRVRDRRQPRVHIGRCGFRHFVAPRGRRPRIAQHAEHVSERSEPGSGDFSFALGSDLSAVTLLRTPFLRPPVFGFPLTNGIL